MMAGRRSTRSISKKIQHRLLVRIFAESLLHIRRIFAEFLGDFRLGFKENLSGPVLRDTARLSQRYPPIARYGVFGVSTWPIGCDTPSPFSERFPLGEHAKWRCDTPPSKGYLSDTCAIPYENKAKACDTPLCDTISKGYCAIWGGISRWAAKRRTSKLRFGKMGGGGQKAGKSHPWTNTSVGGNFRRTFRTIGPYEFPREKVWTNDWSI